MDRFTGGCLCGKARLVAAGRPFRARGLVAAVCAHTPLRTRSRCHGAFRGLAVITFGISIIARTRIDLRNNTWYQTCYCCNLCTNDLHSPRLVHYRVSSHTRGTYVKAALTEGEITMASAIRFNQPGNPEVLNLETLSEQAPGQGEVWLEQEAIGVNFLDVTQRKGAVPVALPSGLGLEGAGRVAVVDAGVCNVQAGDRVAYLRTQVGGLFVLEENIRRLVRSTRRVCASC